MKKLLLIISTLLCLFTSCKQEPKEIINIYADKNLTLLVSEIIETYEAKNKKIKINVSYEKPLFFDKLDILITAEETIFSPTFEKEDSFVEEKTDDKKKKDKAEKNIKENLVINFIENYEASDFTDDKIIVVGRRKINALKDLLYSKLAIPQYNNIVGYLFIEELSAKNLFKDISKKVEYTDDSISAMQKADLYEVDYAIVNSVLSNYIKNTELCYIPTINDEEMKIFYKKYIRKEASEEAMNFYIFLENQKVEKIIEKNKRI